MQETLNSENRAILNKKAVSRDRLPGRLKTKIYFILCEMTGRVKCGIAVNPQRRLGILQVGSPTMLRLIAEMEGDAAREKAIQLRIANCLVHGEWFEYTARVRDVIILELTAHLEADAYAQYVARTRWDKRLPASNDPPYPPKNGRISEN